MKINFHSNIKPTPERKKRNKGIITGLITNACMSALIEPVNRRFVTPSMNKSSESISKSELKRLDDAFEKAFHNSGLKEKGVEIIRITEENIDDTASRITKGFLNKGAGKRLGKIFNKEEFSAGLDEYFKSILNMVAEGKNACFWSMAEIITLPKKGSNMQLVNFHEMGHAINYNYGKIGKILQNIRTPIAKLAPMLILLNALSIRDRKNTTHKNGEGTNNLRQIMKNNAGILGAAAFLPTLIEESLASVNGNRLAKNALKDTPELLKKIRVTNLLSLTSYAIAAITTGLGIHFAVKVKDCLQARYESKLNQSYDKAG